MHKEKGSGLVPWPQRLTAAPPRLEEIGVSREEFQEDTVSFSNYKRMLHDTVISPPSFFDVLFAIFMSDIQPYMNKKFI
jgi:hypothetical protein